MREIIDISVPIRPGMVTYPGDPPVTLERVASIADGDVANLSRLDFGVHSGTHVDAPVHFVDGAAGIDDVPLEVLVGPARVVDLTRAERLDAPAFARLEPTERLLLKTRNSELWSRTTFADDFLALTEDGARALLAASVRLVGIDYLSIGDEAAHNALLQAGVIAIEGLDLRGVEAGEYALVCAPLKLVGSDGGPARAFLVRNSL
ncbi:MAG TPA: cyclase family protein [Gaiellaceae bacterium]|jgi:arylformamidase|nr:cyclase family protein [Gaiellaceae bacterium]